MTMSLTDVLAAASIDSLGDAVIALVITFLTIRLAMAGGAYVLRMLPRFPRLINREGCHRAPLPPL